jgi:hypothetical protein
MSDAAPMAANALAATTKKSRRVGSSTSVVTIASEVDEDKPPGAWPKPGKHHGAERQNNARKSAPFRLSGILRMLLTVFPCPLKMALSPR